MKNHLTSDSNCNTENLELSNPFLQGMMNNVWLTFSVGDMISWSTISIEQDN